MDSFVSFIRDNIVLFDIIFLIFIIYFSLKCFAKGFFLSLISSLKWILALIITIILVPKVEPYISDYIDNQYITGIGLGIFIYIWWAFRNVPNPVRYSVVAITALLHDTLIVVGIFALLGFFLNYEINTMFIIAFLTVLGYSVNDSIVVLDRLRSNIIDFGGMRLSQMVDLSVSQTFGRSLNTSITLLVTLLAMYIFGGDTLKPFILVLIVGVISGTYSSIAIASQILVIWDERN